MTDIMVMIVAVIVLFYYKVKNNSRPNQQASRLVFNMTGIFYR